MEVEAEQVKNVVVAFISLEYTPERLISIAVYDNVRRRLQITSFSDNEHYSSLESLLIQLNPNQSSSEFKVYACLPSIELERKKIVDKLVEIDFQIYDKKLPTGTTLKEPLKMILKQTISFYDRVLADKKCLPVLEALINLLAICSDETNKGSYELEKLEFQKYMKLDKAVVNALMLFPKTFEKKVVSANNTLYDLLNKCKSQMGSKCLRRWMKHPLQNPKQIEQRVKYVEYFVNTPVAKGVIQSKIKKLPDLDTLYFTFYKAQSNKKVTPEVNDIIKFYRTIKNLEQMLEQFIDKGLDDAIGKSIYETIKEKVQIISKLEDMIEKNVIMDDRDKDFYIKPNVQKSLVAIDKLRTQNEKKVQQQIRAVEKWLGQSIEKMPSMQYRFVFEVSKKCIDKVKNTDEYKYISSKQRNITFTTDNMTRLMQQSRTLQEQYKKQQLQILLKMIKIVAGYYPVLEDLSRIISELDVYTAFSTVVNSSQAAWTKPQLREKVIYGESMRHPLVRDCVANDILLNEDHQTIILTGPNMGGKSTYIRTVGICAYLAHIGCFIPAKKFQSPIIDAIITRVGASDMQIKGISTFMSQMMQSACMLKTATNKSLVLIDELGRGTSTHQGFGMAWGICQFLHKKINPFCLFATHFHEMTRMADEVQGVRNMYTMCKCQNDKVKLQYKVIDGIMQNSFGIEVAKMVGFPERVIKDAENYLKMYQFAQKTQQESSRKSNPEAEQIYAQKYSKDTKTKVRMLYYEMNRKIQKSMDEQQTDSIFQEYRGYIQKELMNDVRMDVQSQLIN